MSSDENTIILSNNYPNPFNPVTVINYQIPYSDIVTLKVYDVSGKEVASLVNEMKNAGMHSVTFNASGLTSGFYFYKLSSNGVEQAKKMTLLK
ncbi:MAG: T9SS type A sorting domain-containing protein [Ignavibacteria bacterium]|nr:T9SS type A sorting domain-containing protein [Ignavibacteria bacterium]